MFKWKNRLITIHHAIINVYKKKVYSKDLFIIELVKYFLNKRDDIIEAKNVVNFLRNQFSDSIGGAVILGTIDKRKRLIYYGYDIDRSGKEHRTNWSMKLDNRGLIATDPGGKEYDLVDGFYNLSRENGGSDLELSLK